MDSGGGYPSAEAGTSATSAAEVFELAGDDEDEGDDFWTSKAAAPGANRVSKADDEADESWYDLDEASAAKAVQQPAGPSSATKATGSSKFALFQSVRNKATPFLTKARKALVEEAKHVTEDVRDIAGGVREGMQLARDDLKAQTQSWQQTLGVKLRRGEQQREAAEEHTAAPTEDSSAASSSTAGAPRDTEGEAAESSSAATESRGSEVKRMLKQNLAVTADVSKELWKDIVEVNQDVFKEMRQDMISVREDLRNVRKAFASQEPSKAKSSEENAQDPYWMLPSTRANYVLCQEQAGQLAEASVPAIATVTRVRELGGLLKGKLQRKGQEVSSGVAGRLGHIRQNLKEAVEESPTTQLHRIREKIGIKTRSRIARASSEEGDAVDGNVDGDGDAIFEIGSDEEDAWLDNDLGMSDASTSSTSKSVVPT